MKTRCIICDNQEFITKFYKNKFKIVRCKECNFIFLNPFPNKENSDYFYYRNFNYNTGFSNESIIRSDSRRTLRNIEKLGYSNGPLLDIGCGAGFFLDEANKKGWQIAGIDMSKRLVKYASKHLKLSVINNDFKNYKFIPSYYKVITLIQTIEHITDPHQLLKKVHKILQPKGLLCISTPNIESYLARILKEDFNYMIPPEHVVFYSPFTLKTLLENVNFKIIKIITWGYPSDLALIIKRIIRENKLRQHKNDLQKRKKSTKVNVVYKNLRNTIFEKLFCRIFYPILNFNYGGSILEIYAEKT